MLNFGDSKPRVRGGPGPRGPPGSAPGFYDKLTFKSNFALWSSFQVEFERVVNGLGGQKSSQGSIFIWYNGIQCKNRKCFYWRVTGAKKMYFFGSKT